MNRKYDIKDVYDLDLYDEKALYIRSVCEEICNWIIDEKCTLSQAEKELGYSKSFIHRYIHTYIRFYYDEEFQQIKRILEYNKKYRFKPRKLWEKYYEF